MTRISLFEPVREISIARTSNINGFLFRGTNSSLPTTSLAKSFYLLNLLTLVRLPFSPHILFPLLFLSVLVIFVFLTFSGEQQGPSNFQHTSHVGWTAERGFDINNIPADWKKVLARFYLHPPFPLIPFSFLPGTSSDSLHRFSAAQVSRNPTFKTTQKWPIRCSTS